VFGAIRTVASFGGEERECERFGARVDEALKSGKKKAHVTGAMLGITFLIMFSTFGFGFWFGSKLIREEGYTTGEVMNVFFSVLIGYGCSALNLFSFVSSHAEFFFFF
jgi:ABC-type bacteriocin/lantibiotic exporter with double-glycine peptidase domain